MEAVFQKILEVSIDTSLLAIVILLIRSIFIKKWPARFCLTLWMVLLVRLCLPITLPVFSGSIPHFFDTDFSVIHAQTTVTQNLSSSLSPGIPAQDFQTLSKQSGDLEHQKSILIFSLLSLIWLTGIFIMLSLFLITYLLTGYRIKRESVFQSNDYIPDVSWNSYPIIISPKYKTPFTFGIFHPVIVIPHDIASSADKTTLTFIIKHECQHIKSHDSAANIVLYLLKTLYWFNPLIWLAVHMIQNDMEMACDEKVTIDFSLSEKKEYAVSILSCASFSYHAPLLYPSFAQTNLKNRIGHILLDLSKKRRYIFMTCLFMMLLIFLSFGLSACHADSEKERIPKLYQFVSSALMQHTNSADSVEKTVKMLSPPDNFHTYHHISYDAQTPDTLTVYYRLTDENGKPTPYFMSKAENNALILMASFPKINHIIFAFTDYIDSTNYASQYAFHRASLTKKFGDIDALSQNSTQLSHMLQNNIAFDEERANYNRIRWGTNRKTILTRNGNPVSTNKQPDGSIVMTYEKLGAVSKTENDKTTVVDPGNTVRFYLDSPEIIKKYHINGVYKIVYEIKSQKGGMELLWNADLEASSTDQQVISKLGNPTRIKRELNGSKTIYYPVFNRPHELVFFTFSGKKMISCGITVDIVG